MNLAVLPAFCPSFRLFYDFHHRFNRATEGAAPRGVRRNRGRPHDFGRLAFAAALASAFAFFAARASSAISLPSHCRMGVGADFRSQTIRFMRAQKHFSSRAVVNHIETGHVSHAGEGSGRCLSSRLAKTGLQ